ncbi:MAG: hypothetical protein Ct9H90mP25_5770 [Gammaproteobacteria bacterium]|nr:MAG: hypothetical protein Ct9H90mP25_5770 [Gammaproteobacteria bacterium]
MMFITKCWGVWTQGPAEGLLEPNTCICFKKICDRKNCRGFWGFNGEYVTSPDQMTPALERAYKLASDEGISTLINCQGKKEFWTNQYPPSMPRHFAPGALAYYK